MMRIPITFVVLIAACTSTTAMPHAGAPRATGNASIDLASSPTMPDSLNPRSPLHWSSSRAILYSAILPGAGQAYVGEWWKAALFFGVEVAGVTGAIVYNARGNSQTERFQNYADENWSAVRYAQYVNAFVAQYNLDSQRIAIDPSATKKPWERVDWETMNKLEKKIGNFNQATGYSHTLPPHGDQQYFEEIGKFPQYGHGWNDDPSPDHLGISDARVITNNLQYYAGERGKANNLYSASTTATIVVLLNHVVSAIEAGFSARAHNRSIQLGFRSEPAARNGYTDIRSTISLSIRL
jgi:hypothetical protein